jgi:MurNAc alpha-1-phosphate uridylyltransferase
MPARALILAAGRGERLRPLTDHTPKPLLLVRARPLIEWHLLALARGGVRDVVVNTAWLEDQFPAALGDGSRWGLRLHYSCEGRDHGGALETAGGIAKALPLLGDPFWVVSGDVFLPGFDFDPAAVQRFQGGHAGHLWLVPNAPHHPQGDFGIDDRHRPPWPMRPSASPGPASACSRRRMFDGIVPGTRLPLRPLLDRAIAQQRLGAERWPGWWTDVGTAERLAALNRLPGPCVPSARQRRA